MKKQQKKILKKLSNGKKILLNGIVEKFLQPLRLV